MWIAAKWSYPGAPHGVKVYEFGRFAKAPLRGWLTRKTFILLLVLHRGADHADVLSVMLSLDGQPTFRRGRKLYIHP